MTPDDPSTAVPASGSEGPDWPQILHEVHCPLCEYNLRGLREPRCPECGYGFEWPDVLNPRRADHAYLFEHRADRNLWSFRRTILACWRPRSFWKLLHPTQRSRPRRLVIYWLLGLPALVMALAAMFVSAAQIDVNQIAQQRARMAADLHRYRGLQSIQGLITTYGSIDKYLDTVLPLPTFKRAMVARWLASPLPETVRFNALVIPLVWPWVSLLALQVFQISMRRARIRSMHVLRCVLYSFDLVLWSLLFTLAAAAMAFTADPDRLQTGLLVARNLAILIGTWRLAMAYREYLRFHRPFATAISAMVITAMLILAFRCLTEPRRAYHEVLTDPLLGPLLRW